MIDEKFLIYYNKPSLDSFVDLSEQFKRVMTYRYSRSANHHKIKKRGRLLREMKEFQFIEFDLQSMVMSSERRCLQKKALQVAQEIVFQNDSEEIQKKQKVNHNQKQNIGYKKEQTAMFQEDHNVDFFEQNPMDNFKFSSPNGSSNNFDGVKVNNPPGDSFFSWDNWQAPF